METMPSPKLGGDIGKLLGLPNLGNLPGAPNPIAQQKVDQSQQSGGILKMRQPQNQFGGGKSGPGGPIFGGGGGKYAIGGPAITTSGPLDNSGDMYSGFGNAAANNPNSLYNGQ